MSLRLLLVDDNEQYRTAAAAALHNLPDNKGLVIHHAADFEEFSITPHASRDLDGALVDCFFPYQTGSNKKELGERVIESIADKKLSERVQQDIETFKEFVDITNPIIRDKLGASIRVAYQHGKNAESYLPLHVIKHISRTCGVELANLLFTKGDTIDIINRYAPRDYFAELNAYLQKDEANQPLGIAVAEKLEAERVPFVLCTSTYHHDNVTQPIQNYAGKRGWTLVDCAENKPEQKATPEYWHRAFEALKGRMGAQNGK